MGWEQFLIASAIILVAYFIRGITGFGSGLIAVPLLALFQPLTFVVPLILLLDFTASVVLGGFDRKRVQWQELVWLLPFSVVGVIVGARLLVNLPVMPMLIGLSLFVLVFAIRNLFNVHGEKKISRGWSVPAALTGGIVGSLFGTGGPPYIIYLNHRISDKRNLRATFSVLFVMEGLMRIVTFFASGLLLSTLIWWNALALLPLVLASLYLGGRIHTGLSQQQIVRLIGLLLLVSSISLFVKAMTLK